MNCTVHFTIIFFGSELQLMSKTEMVEARKHALPSVVLYGLAGTLIFVGSLTCTRINRMVWFNIIDRRAVAYIHNCLCLLADQKSYCNCYRWWCFDTYRNIYEPKETDNSMSVIPVAFSAEHKSMLEHCKMIS